MPAYQIAIEMLDDLKRDYRYQSGHWFYRSANRWRTAAPPRLVIWQAMTQRQRLGVQPSTALANDIQTCLETVFENRRQPAAV